MMEACEKSFMFCINKTLQNLNKCYMMDEMGDGFWKL